MAHGKPIRRAAWAQRLRRGACGRSDVELRFDEIRPASLPMRKEMQSAAQSQQYRHQCEKPEEKAADYRTAWR
jgi:hypothetical protein